MTEERPELAETLDAPVYEPPNERKRHSALIRRLILLAVIAIVIIGTIGYGTIWGLSRPSPSAVRTLCASLINNAHMACETFRRAKGFYPWDAGKEVTASSEIRGRDVCTELRALPTARINTRQAFIEVGPQLLKDGALVDPWGHEIQFRVDPETGRPVIWSLGPNGINETNDGDSPDPAKLPKGYYWFGRGDTGDDIVAR